MDLKDFIRDVPDFPKPGILFRDITPLLRDAEALATTIDRLADRAANWQAEVVAGIESRGFVFGTALAVHMGLGFVPIRKPGRLPCPTHRQEYDLEYGQDAVEMHQDAVRPGQRVLMVDDLLATGGTMNASCALIQRAGAVVAGCLFVIELTGLNGRDRIPSYQATSLLSY